MSEAPVSNCECKNTDVFSVLGSCVVQFGSLEILKILAALDFCIWGQLPQWQIGIEGGREQVPGGRHKWLCPQKDGWPVCPVAIPWSKNDHQGWTVFFPFHHVFFLLKGRWYPEHSMCFVHIKTYGLKPQWLTSALQSMSLCLQWAWGPSSCSSGRQLSVSLIYSAEHSLPSIQLHWSRFSPHCCWY